MRGCIGLALLVAFLACGCGGKPVDSGQAKIDELQSQLDTLERNRIANLPTDQLTRDLLTEAEGYYIDPKFIWGECRSLAAQLTKVGHPTTPNQLLHGCVDVMKRSGVRAEQDQRIREFCTLYEMRRIDPYREDGRKGPATHDEAIDLLVRDEKFANHD